jgi:hypothetical protein
MAGEIYYDDIIGLFEKLPLVVPVKTAPPGTVDEDQCPKPLPYAPPAGNVTDLLSITLDYWHHDPFQNQKMIIALPN